MNQSQCILDMICGTPLGFVVCYPFLPSVRCATLGFGVELRCSSFQFGVLEMPFINNTVAISSHRSGFTPWSRESTSQQSRRKAAPTT